MKNVDIKVRYDGSKWIIINDLWIRLDETIENMKIISKVLECEFEKVI